VRVGSLVLDNEAVAALLDVGHHKHGRVVAVLAELNGRDRRRRRRTPILVPTTVRLEAGWDRSRAAAANANRITRAIDHVIDTQAADRAIQLRQTTRVSLVDATIGHALEVAPQPVAVLTSDVDDMRRLAAASSAIDARVVGV
jgi:hypothetical protein